MARIELDEVWKAYADGTVAVEALDLAIEDGEFVVLVGPSGSGKTTALRMVAGLEDITAGEIRIDGKVVNDLPPRDRDVAMVFQNYALYPHLSVSDNIAFGLKLRGFDKRETARRVRQTATLLGIEDLLDRKPRALSGGQRQRVAMGRAIVREPKAFLMDEPLSNLDAKLRVQVRAEILHLQQRLGVTAMYVTHDQVEAMTMGHRVAVLRRGTLQQYDVPRVLYDEPVNLFVGGFIGSPAMNMIAATVTRHDGRWTARFGRHRLALGEETVARHAGIAAYDGREVVLGIRPEDMEDAALLSDADPDRRLETKADLVESLGSESLVHFTLDVPPVVTDDLRELAEDVGAGLDTGTRAVASPFVARVNPRSTIAAGDRIALHVDVDRVHLFDPGTGLAIRSETVAAPARRDDGPSPRPEPPEDLQTDQPPVTSSPAELVTEE
jgi:multiple sugar transport system ATP-binding protein